VKQRRDLLLVDLQVLERVGGRGVLLGGVLQLQHAERQSVHEDHDVRPAVDRSFDAGELVDREPVVSVESVEIH